MCRPSQASQPSGPVSRRPLGNSATAAWRPIVAIEPLSWYSNGASSPDAPDAPDAPDTSAPAIRWAT